MQGLPRRPSWWHLPRGEVPGKGWRGPGGTKGEGRWPKPPLPSSGLFPGTFSCEKRMGGMRPGHYPNPPHKGSVPNCVQPPGGAGGPSRACNQQIRLRNSNRQPGTGDIGNAIRGRASPPAAGRMRAARLCGGERRCRPRSPHEPRGKVARDAPGLL